MLGPHCRSFLAFIAGVFSFLISTLFVGLYCRFLLCLFISLCESIILLSVLFILLLPSILSLESNMSETRKTKVVQTEEIIRPQQPGELQNIQAAYRLDGSNYLKWSQLIRTVLKGRGKISHLLGTG